MEQFWEKGHKNNTEDKKIIFSFEFHTDKGEVREEYQGLDITFWARDLEEKSNNDFVDININIYPRRGNLKDLNGMKVMLKKYGYNEMKAQEEFVETGFVTFENIKRGIYTIEFFLKEIKRDKNFDTYKV